MVNLPDLGRTYSIRSTLRSTPSFLRSQFGDGYAQQQPAGLNHIRSEYNISYELLDETDATTLRQFVYQYATGELITVKLYNIDPTGTKTAKFRIQSWTETPAGPLNYDFNVLMEGPYEEPLNV